MKIIDEAETIINEQMYKVKITWRFIFWVFIITLVLFFNFNATINYYENKAFAGVIFALSVFSYILSVFLVRRR